MTGHLRQLHELARCVPSHDFTGRSGVPTLLPLHLTLWGTFKHHLLFPPVLVLVVPHAEDALPCFAYVVNSSFHATEMERVVCISGAGVGALQEDAR